MSDLMKEHIARYNKDGSEKYPYTQEDLLKLADFTEDVFGIRFNMNDVFFYACADDLEVDSDDIDDLKAFYLKYGDTALIAYKSLLEGITPHGRTLERHPLLDQVKAEMVEVSKEEYHFDTLKEKMVEVSKEEYHFDTLKEKMQLSKEERSYDELTSELWKATWIPSTCKYLKDQKLITLCRDMQEALKALTDYVKENKDAIIEVASRETK